MKIVKDFFASANRTSLKIKEKAMRFSKMLIPTLREIPADAEAISHILMLRAGYIRQLASGLYIYLPLSLKVIEKINKILREEMNAIGGIEMKTSAFQSREVWEKTNRWDDKVVDNWFKKR